ncbi:uncharacterized protein LOC125716737 isoform X3 [Brienomyrus brachyistius]|uniref:uncharacterized protein LOC125716737 isoform X3 n=1 Tax=Brienomyrus brachyistius TaxID=42636 RepID=UPI0020B20B85|nr:uncharacterized protein LOC125716737 isoform X3 [Brienomyrus brachyistius]
MKESFQIESLVVVDEATAQKLRNLKTGQKLCSTCMKRASEEEKDFTEQSDSSEDFQCQDLSSESLDDTVRILDCSPLKSVGNRDRISYAKRKLNQVHSAVKEKCARALNFPVDFLESLDEEKECQGCKDLDRLLTLLKERVRSAPNHREKIKLLTLAPESWSQQQTAKEFGVTIYLVKRAREHKKKEGILAEVAPKKGWALSEDIVQRIIAHYQDEEFSRMCPGMKDCVSVKTDDGTVYKQKRLILVNLKELYLEYTKRHPDDDVGISKFCELRPLWCRTVNASGMHSACVCQIHQNVKLMTAALPGSDTYKDILEKMVCCTENRDCMLHLCDDCPGSDALDLYLTNLFKDSEYDLDDEISFQQWGQTDRTEIVTMTMSVQEFIDKICDAFDNLREHHFIAKAQAKYLRETKENLCAGEAVILLDFAENYSFIVQDAVQGFHWNTAQATLHPFVVYYKDGGELKSLSLCVISDCLRHDTFAVHAFISKVLDNIRNELPPISRIMYFSDGAAGQYKNCKNFSNLCNHKEDFGILAEWHFFATSHGKSPCDGIGGTVKRLTAKASLQATTSGQILTPGGMFKWASQHITGIQFFFVTSQNISENAEKFKLTERFALAKTLTGTRSHHCFLLSDNEELMMKRISADVDHSQVCTPGVNDEVKEDQLLPGKYVACLYDRKWYVGCILEYSQEEHDVKVDFMKHSESSGLFSWPSENRRDKCWIPVQHVLCFIGALDSQGQSTRFYKFSLDDEDRIERNFLKH